MSELSSPALRALVAEAVRDALAELMPARTGATASDESAGPATSSVAGSEYVVRGPARRRTQEVRLSSDQDLTAFVHQLLHMFENPKTREDLRNGWLRFTLIGGRPSAGIPSRVGSTATASTSTRIERGAVTERTVADAAGRGEGIVLACGAVLTPLARDKARALGIHIEKER